VIRIQKDDEHARARIFRHLVALALRVWFGARLLGSGWTNDHVLEGLDLLRRPVFEHFEVPRRQVGYRHASLRRKDVDPYEVRFRAERGLGLLRGEADGGENDARKPETDPGRQRSKGKGHLVVPCAGRLAPQCISGIATQGFHTRCDSLHACIA
jgi:hypothetical protein